MGGLARPIKIRFPALALARKIAELSPLMGTVQGLEGRSRHFGRVVKARAC